MSEHHAAIDVTDGIHALDIGLHLVVYLNATTANGHTDGVKAFEQYWLTANRHKHAIGNKALLFALEVVGHCQALVARGDGLHAGLSHNLDAALAQCLAQAFGDVFVKWWQDFLAELDNSYLHTIGVEDGGKLHADDATAHDAQALGQFGH